MDSLPTNFIKAGGEPSKRASAIRPAPFSADEFNSESIEQGSQAYVHHVEKGSLPLEDNSTVTDEDRHEETSQPGLGNSRRAVTDKPKQSSRKREPVKGQIAAKPTAVATEKKANIRLEINADVRKDMIKIKHKVGITHGVEVSYAAYFMFLHERCRTETNTATFLSDLAGFTEQLKRT